MSNLRDFRPDPRLAEEYSARQERLNQQQLAGLAEEGDIAASGIREMGDIAAKAGPNAVQSYRAGQNQRDQLQANQLRQQLSQNELAKAKSEDDFWNAPDEKTGISRRQQQYDMGQQKSEEELAQLREGKKNTQSWAPTGKVDKQGHPILYNRVSGEEKVLPSVAQASGAGKGSITPYQKTMLDNASEQKLDTKTRQYAQDLQKTNIPTAVTQLERVYSLLPPKGDAPGYGRAAGMLPDAFVTQDGEDLRQSVQAVFNIELKDRSGAAVSDQELARLKREFGQGTWKTGDQLRKGLAQYEARLKEVMRNIDAGADTEARSRYVKQGGRDFTSWKGRGFSPVAAPPGTASAAPGTKADADMTDEEIDAEIARLKGGK